MKTEKVVISQIESSSEKKLVFHDQNIYQVSHLASSFARLLKAADTLLLLGDIGSGKTFFARKVIQRMMLNQGVSVEEVPSPTFTIVQVYDLIIPTVWHFDLYRLSSFEEIIELGLEDAFDSGISLIEWPDQMGPYIPKRNISIAFHQGKADFDSRTIVIEFHGTGWEDTADGLIRNLLT